ncbi:MAG: Holliday junction resolvase RuvX [Bacteroidota bacterium]
MLAIDYGAKRTGIAITDPLGMIASPHDVVKTHHLNTYLENYFKKEEVEQVIIGLPKKENGEKTNATSLVRDYIRSFKNKFPSLPIIEHDERYTSKLALDAMITGGTKKSYRQDKGNIDKISAAIILQSYLERIS